MLAAFGADSIAVPSSSLSSSTSIGASVKFSGVSKEVNKGGLLAPEVNNGNCELNSLLGGFTGSDINDGTEVDIAEPPRLFGGSVEGNIVDEGQMTC